MKAHRPVARGIKLHRPDIVGAALVGALDPDTAAAAQGVGGIEIGLQADLGPEHRGVVHLVAGVHHEAHILVAADGGDLEADAVLALVVVADAAEQGGAVVDAVVVGQGIGVDDVGIA